MSPYQTGEPELDKLISELVREAGGGKNSDLVQEMIITALKLLHFLINPERGLK